MGTFWGSVSSPGCEEIVDSADAYLFAGPVFTDYTTVGYNLLLKKNKLIVADPCSINIAGDTYNQVGMRDFLGALASKVIANNTSLVTETGDSWFNGMRMKLPKGYSFEIQMQYGSIGWSVGATLGYQAAVADSRRVIALIGDGSFQMTAQELSTMVRYQLKPVIFLFKNGGYTIEVEIHDGPYNVINNWNYAGLIDVFNRGAETACLARQVKTAGELQSAIADALAFDGLCFTEVFVDKDDCNKNLLKWGSYVGMANGEPPLSF